MKNNVLITFFAHGTTTDNEKGLATGWRHGELSGLGIRQSKTLGKLAAGRRFDAVFCSDLKRAADSARLAFGEKCPIIRDKRLRECDYGGFTGRQAGEFESRLAEFVDRPFPNGESYKDVEKRVAAFLDLLKKNYAGKHVAIVAHQATQLALEVLIKGKTWKQAIGQDWRRTKAWQPGWEYRLV